MNIWEWGLLFLSVLAVGVAFWVLRMERSVAEVKDTVKHNVGWLRKHR